jgi:hypothetical protein
MFLFHLILLFFYLLIFENYLSDWLEELLCCFSISFDGTANAVTFNVKIIVMATAVYNT